MVDCAGLENRRPERVRGSESLPIRHVELKSKIIFLDCDGVLNKACLGADKRYFHPDCFRAFQRIVRETGAKVVLSSSWREFPDWYEMLVDFFAVIGIEIVDKVPVLGIGTRESEIDRWMSENLASLGEWVVIDDWDMSESFPGHFVHTCSPGSIGLTEELADAAIGILGKDKCGI